MARQVLPWVGAAVGSIWGQPQIGFAIGSMIGNAVDPQVIKGPSLGEGQNNTASEGGYRPIVLGKGRVGVCMIHEGPMIKRTIRHRQSKGGGPITEEERAYRTMAFALGESAFPDEGVLLLRLWVDNKLRYDATPGSQIPEESLAFGSDFRFYPGDNEQLPDPDLESFMGAGNVPSYRGGAPYIVFPEWDVTDSGGRAPMILAELATAGDVDNTQWVTVGVEGSLPYIQPSDGSSWMATPYSQYGLGSWVVANETRMINYSNSAGYMSYSDDGGATANIIDPWPIVSSGWKGIWANGMFWLPCNNQGYATSPDGVNDWVQFPTYAGAGSLTICAAGNIMVMAGTTVGAGQGVNTRYSTAYGAPGSWSPNFLGLINPNTGNGATTTASGTDGSIIVLGGHDHAMAWTANGADFTQIVSPFSNGSGGGPPTRFVGRIVYGIDRHGEPLWIATSGMNDGGTQGQTAWSRNGIVWQLLTSGVYGQNILDCAYGARQFVAVSGGGTIKVLDDVEVGWVDQTTAWASNSVINSVAALLRPQVINPDMMELSEIVDFVHGRVDMETSDYNTDALTDLVEGVVFADGYTGASAIGAAMGWYQFDAAEADFGAGYRINYVKRGGAAEATLTEDDIVDGPEDWEREDSYERPRVLHVTYPNPIADYGAPVIPIKRTSPDVLVVGERSINVPFVTSDQDEVARRGDVAMTVIYTEIAGDYEIILPDSFLWLAPTNCIGFSIRGRTRRLRMTEWRYVDGTIKTKWKADRQSSYTSNLTALPAVPSKPPPPTLVGPTVSAVLDIPAPADSLDTLHLLVAHSGQTEAWWGSVHQRKLEVESSYTTDAQFTLGSIMGTLDADVTDASQHFTDTTNVVRVTLSVADELETFTQQQFLSEHGAFALSWDDSGARRWEVMQYRDAVKVGDRTWELTTLARGRLNTETAAHPTGATFVLLETVRAIPAQSSWIGQDITHRAVSNGQLPDQATPYTQEFTGESQREWPVASVSAAINAGTLSASWVPRHRFGTDDAPIRSANWTGYRVTATDGVNTTTVDTTSDSHTFNVSGWSTPIDVTVSQLNRITGEGPAVTEEVA